MNIWNRLPCSAVSHVIPSVDNFHKFAIPAIRDMVLLSFKFHMNVFILFFYVYFFFFFIHIVNNSVLFTSYFYIFLLVVVFVFWQSSIPV